MGNVREAIFVPNNPDAPRLCPELASEIGLNESILLLQIEFWIRNSSTEEHDGKQWTYQSVRDMQKFFSFWSLATINRAVNSLLEKGLLFEGNYNKARYDRTRWFAVNQDGVRQLKSVRLANLGGHDTRSNQNETRSTQIDTRSSQFETTIPETTTETTTENIEDSGQKPPAPPEPPKAEKPAKAKADLFPIASTLSEVCQMPLEINRGRLFREAKQLCAAAVVPPVTPDEIHARYGPGGWWYREDWRGQKGEPPTPAVIKATWGQWTKAKVIPITRAKPTKADLLAQIQAQWDEEDGNTRNDQSDSTIIFEHIPAESGRGAERGTFAAGMAGRAGRCT